LGAFFEPELVVWPGSGTLIVSPLKTNQECPKINFVVVIAKRFLTSLVIDSFSQCSFNFTKDNHASHYGISEFL
jgi:hypothetical protein